MSNSQSAGNCKLVCWIVALVIGLLVLWLTASTVGFLAGLLMGLALAVLVGLVLTRLFCAATASGSSSDGMMQTPKATAAPAKPVATPESAEVPAAKVVETSTLAQAAVATTGDSDAMLVKSGTILSGETELKARKGEWKYQGAAAAKPPAPKKAPAKKAAPKATKKTAAKASADVTPDFDGDGKLEGTNEGTRPEALKAPRGGKADDLKQIKGVGPKLQDMLNDMGFYHFDQIAGWTPSEVAWVNANLKGFKGRVTRDNWIEQAATLAVGGQTEFSKRVEDGGVY